MSNVISGLDALNALEDTGENGSSKSWTSLKSGTSFNVKVIGQEIDLGSSKKHVGDFFSFFSYGIFEEVDSFVAEKPSKKSAKGYPVEDLTPWDKAWKYHADLSEKFQDYHSGEANKYRPKQRFAFGFINLEDGEPIVVDFSKNQAQAINKSIEKYGNKLNKVAFELSKDGQRQNTVVSLTPLIDMDEDLTDKERKHFEEAPKEFDLEAFEGILFEADEAEQIKNLNKAGFDISQIGLSMPAEGGVEREEENASVENKEPVKPFEGVADADNIQDGDLPF